MYIYKHILLLLSLFRYELLKTFSEAAKAKSSLARDLVMSYFKNLKINSAESDNVEVLDSRYFTKGYYMVKTIYNYDDTYSVEEFISYPSTLYTSGYDLIVFIIYIYILF